MRANKRNYKKIDWPCEVKTLFHKENLGCGLGPLTAINWFFENVEEGIILEDDCVPDQSFFYFCQELLEYYRNNKKIMHISGDNFQYGKNGVFLLIIFQNMLMVGAGQLGEEPGNIIILNF